MESVTEALVLEYVGLKDYSYLYTFVKLKNQSLDII